MPLSTDVIVVGAGPAGSAAALMLARRGHAVVLLDRSAFPRDKVCGEGIMPHGVRALERLGLLDRAREAGSLPFRGIAYHAAGHRAVGRFPDGSEGLGIRRLRLDHALHGGLREAGVDLRTGVRVRGVEGVPGRVEVRTDAGVLRSRAVVGADGLHSVVRRQAGLQRPGRGRPRYGVRAHFHLAPDRPDRDLVEVHLADGGEFYLTPVAPGEVNVALLLERDAARALRGDLEGGFRAMCAACPPIAALLEGAESSGPVQLCGPLRQEASDVVDDALLLVGDAAGFLDGITGEGTSLALLEAELAVEVLDEGLRRGRLRAADLAPYRSRRRRAARDLTLLTEVILWGIRHRRLAERVVANLARRPELFGQLLAIQAGEVAVTGLGLRGLLRMVGPAWR